MILKISFKWKAFCEVVRSQMKMEMFDYLCNLYYLVEKFIFKIIGNFKIIIPSLQSKK